LKELGEDCKHRSGESIGEVINTQWCMIHKLSWWWRLKWFPPGYRNQTLWWHYNHWIAQA